ncbi:MAG: DUF134 domain-containing protein [Candidatus Latescibacterota bacterium]
MARPFKCRRVAFQPEVQYFKPRGILVRELDEVVLTVDEYEAIRLADLEGLYQEKAARKMNVSRQTFGNILSAAHKKIADGLINGKAIKIHGGVVEMDETRKFTCSDCKHQWDAEFGSGRPAACPECSATNIHRAPAERVFAGGRKQRSGQGGGRGKGTCGRSNE